MGQTQRYLTTTLARLKSAPHDAGTQLDFPRDYTIELGADNLINFEAAESSSLPPNYAL